MDSLPAVEALTGGRVDSWIMRHVIKSSKLRTSETHAILVINVIPPRASHYRRRLMHGFFMVYSHSNGIGSCLHETDFWKNEVASLVSFESVPSAPGFKRSHKSGKRSRTVSTTDRFPPVAWRVKSVLSGPYT